MLPNASEFLAINANLLKIAFERAFAREIQYMGEQYYVEDKQTFCNLMSKVHNFMAGLNKLYYFSHACMLV